MHPMVLHSIIDVMAETARRTNSRHAIEKGLLEEALDDLQRTRVPAPWVDMKRPFKEAPPGYRRTGEKSTSTYHARTGYAAPPSGSNAWMGGKSLATPKTTPQGTSPSSPTCMPPKYTM